MGFIRTSFTFLLGSATGVYIAQSYNVPNIRALYHEVFSKAKNYEETYRKPESKDDMKR